MKFESAFGEKDPERRKALIEDVITGADWQDRLSKYTNAYGGCIDDAPYIEVTEIDFCEHGATAVVEVEWAELQTTGCQDHPYPHSHSGTFTIKIEDAGLHWDFSDVIINEFESVPNDYY